MSEQTMTRFVKIAAKRPSAKDFWAKVREVAPDGKQPTLALPLLLAMTRTNARSRK